jgi:hypothetical protein
VWTPLFTPDSPLGQIFSDRVEVRPGKVFMFRAHDLPEDRSVYACSVSPLVLRHPWPRPLSWPAVDGYLARMTLGGADAWTLDAGHPLLLVSLPGLYRFELEDPDVLDGPFRLEYAFWGADPAPFFPVMR